MLPLPTGRDANSGVGASVYTRHRPERTLLYQLVQEYYPAFKAHLAAEGMVLRGYVEQEFEDYLKYERLEHRFLWVRCDACHAEHLVAFSRKKCCFVRAVGRGAWLTSVGMHKVEQCRSNCRNCGFVRGRGSARAAAAAIGAELSASVTLSGGLSPNYSLLSRWMDQSSYGTNAARER